MAACQASPESAMIGSVDRLDARLDALVDPESAFEVLAEGFDWSEGPVWVPQEQFLLFSDIPPNTIFRWDAAGGARAFLQPSGYTGTEPRGGEVGSNGLVLDSLGRLVLAQHGDRRIARLSGPVAAPSADYVTLADKYEGARFNSPNDLVYHSSGDLYFTDPPYGLEGRMQDPAKEIDFQGVYRLAVGGSVTLLTSELSRPNGIGFSPDEKTLYVANSDPSRAIWMAYDVDADGLLQSGRVFFDATDLVGPELPGLPDGLQVDSQGNIFATGPGGVLVFSPDGTHLGTLLTTQATSNCTLGEDGSSLFVTADMYLLRMRLRPKS